MFGSIRRPSPALVVATLALIVSLSGVAYAATALPRNSVGTLQLKNGAVTTKKVKNRSLVALDFKLGQLPAGAAGAQGIKGDKGDKGDTGATGSAGVTELQRVSAETTLNNLTGVKEVTASCPSGKRVVGGGAETVTTTSYPITKSIPRGDLSGWTAMGYKAAPSLDKWAVRAIALCAKVS